MLTLYTKDDKKILSLSVGDNSYRHRELMGENTLTLYFELSKHVEIPIGAYVDFGGERYTLMRPEALKMHHTRHFEYTLTLDSAQGKMKLWKMRNLVDGRLKFTLTAKPIEHLRLLVDNLNRREMGWSVGTCTDDVEHLVSYDHASCWEALGRIAEEFKTEFEIVGRTINLGKVEHERSNPLSLAYGKGKGFISGVGRSNQGDNPPTEVLFVQGGERNIDASKYGSSTLHLPKQGQIKYDGQHFEGEAGYDAARANTYIVDDLGLSVRRHGGQIVSGAEDSLDASSIYPKRVGKVSEVIVENAKKNFYDFVDASLPDALNYNDCLIAGEKMTVIFQSGMLAGCEFEVKYHHDIKGTKKSRRFEIVPQEVDGQTMPNATYCPRVGDEYAVFHCQLPQVYISQPAQKVGAEWDMLRKAVKHLYEHEQQTFTFTGELDGIWARRNWVNVGGRLRLGGFVRFTDPQFQPQGVDVRIIGIKDNINNPHAPQIELSNAPLSGSFSTTISKLEAQKLEAEQLTKAAVQFTQRQFRDARETMEMLEAAMADKFTRAISPAAVQTMALLVGDESLQFRFVSSRATPTPVVHEIRYDSATKQLRVGAGLLQHLTIGIKSISSAHSPKEYRFWDIPAFTSGRLDVEEKKYYLYVRVPRNGNSGAFYLSETAKSMDSEPNFYHLLVGILNSEYGGERSFVKLYGYSEILPGRITTDRIVSSDGRSYFDMVANAMKLGDALDFNSRGDGRLLLRGTLVQNDGGEAAPIPLYRGEWNASATYYQGDEVVRTENGVVTSYRYVSSAPSAGKPLSDTSVWAISAKGANGQKGDAGRDGRDGAKGDKGDTGQRGADGAAGRDGAKGETGAQGPQGEKGLPGKNGVDGKSYTPNLLDNSAFGKDLAQWWKNYPNAGITLDDSTASPVVGTRVLKILPNGGDHIYLATTIGKVLRPNTTYTFSVWAKQPPNASAAVFYMYGTPNIWTHIYGAEGTWQRFTHTFTTPAEISTSTTLCLLNFKNADPNYVAYFAAPKLEMGDTATAWTSSEADRKGADGHNGKDGADGRSSYTHVRYSNDGGQTFTAATAEAIEAAKKMRGAGVNLVSTMHRPDGDYSKPWCTNGGVYSLLTQAADLPAGAYRGLRCVQSRVNDGAYHYNRYNINGGKSYTLSFWARADAARRFFYGAQGIATPIITLTTEWKKYVLTFTLPASASQVVLVFYGQEVGTFEYADVKLEEGSVASTWTPFPVDAAKGTTPARYRGELVSEQPVASVEPKDYTWIDTKGEKGDGGKDGLTPLPNLLRNADLPSELGAWGVNRTDNACSAQRDPSVTPPIADAQVWGLSPSNQANSFAELHQDVDLIAGRTYTFSVYTKGATAGWLIGYPQGTHFHLKSDAAETLGEWKRFSSTFSATASGRSKFYLRAWNKNGNSGKVLFSCPKAEEGTQATPWTRAAEDFRPDYTEMRFAVNGSRTAPPVLNLKERSPQGWSIGQPAVGQMQFLWMSTAQVSGATDVLKSDWSAPVRITPADGQKGDSPAMAYRGEYDAAKTYYGTAYRVDVVKYGKEYFVARTDAGEFRAVAPPNASKWNNFGANFESVATQLLLAEDANIGDWYLSQGSIVSTLNESSWISLDARENEIAMHTDHGGGRSTDITLDASSGSINVQTKDANGLKDAASISGDGMFSNNAGVRCWPSTTGIQQFAAMCGYGVANLARAPYAIPDDFDSYAVVGVFGRAENTNTTQYKAPAYGGLFYQLKVCGFVQNVKKIADSDLNTQLSIHHTRVIGLTSNSKDANVRLPSRAVEGQTILFTQVGDGSMSILPPIGDGEHRILRYGNAPQTSWIVLRGETVCLTMIEGVVLAGQNGYKVWVVEMK
ncbi:MAG: carbohydrate binding domain-containing protein [Alloprevotella sp.]